MTNLQKFTIYISLIVIATGLLITWTVLAYRDSLRTSKPDAQQQAREACINQNGVPILGGSGGTMTACKFRGEK